MGAKKIKSSYVLPAAIVLGLLLHRYCTMCSFLVPYLIFAILLFTFSAVDLRRLMRLRNCFHPLNLCLMAFQTVMSIGAYMVLRLLHIDIIIAEGVLIGVLCPVASSVTVISCMLGADRGHVTNYTVMGNLLVALLAPLLFSIIGVHKDMTFLTSFWLIVQRTAPSLALPFVVALVMQTWFPKANDVLARRAGWSFYLWSLALLFTLGQTIDFIFLHGDGQWHIIAWLGVLAIVLCAVQFGFGRRLGRRFGDTVSGGQLLGQKNTAMGIWMANTFLSPLASVLMAFYSIGQNLFNSWQIWHYEHKQQP